MTVMAELPWGRSLTVADLDLMPDDGHRYELIDGVLLVSPAPSTLHQHLVLRLARILEDDCPADLKVFLAPLDVDLAEDTRLQPDVLVARRADLTERGLPAAPVLAVEVASPSTRRFDYMTKRARFEAAGTPAFWVLDPELPALTAWNLQDAEYAQVANVLGDETYEAVLPFPVTVSPARLVADY